MTLKFGEPVTNIGAGEGNPQKHGLFVRYVRRTGRVNSGTWVQMTDGKGAFWEVHPRSVIPGKEKN